MQRLPAIGRKINSVRPIIPQNHLVPSPLHAPRGIADSRLLPRPAHPHVITVVEFPRGIEADHQIIQRLWSDLQRLRSLVAPIGVNGAKSQPTILGYLNLLVSSRSEIARDGQLLAHLRTLDVDAITIGRVKHSAAHADRREGQGNPDQDGLACGVVDTNVQSIAIGIAVQCLGRETLTRGREIRVWHEGIEAYIASTPYGLHEIGRPIWFHADPSAGPKREASRLIRNEGESLTISAVNTDIVSVIGQCVGLAIPSQAEGIYPQVLSGIGRLRNDQLVAAAVFQK